MNDTSSFVDYTRNLSRVARPDEVDLAHELMMVETMIHLQAMRARRIGQAEGRGGMAPELAPELAPGIASGIDRGGATRPEAPRVAHGR